jgi:hypothetical protein
MATSAPACRTTNLVIWRGAPGDGVTGGTYHELEFTNVGSAACTLDGYPRVIGVDRGGAQLGRAAGHDAYAAPSAVVLRPGTTAHAVLRISDVGDFSPASCHPTRAVGVKVFPPGRPRGTVVPLRFEACSASGPTYLTVRVVRPRVGVPGVSQ